MRLRTSLTLCALTGALVGLGIAAWAESHDTAPDETAAYRTETEALRQEVLVLQAQIHAMTLRQAKLYACWKPIDNYIRTVEDERERQEAIEP